MAKMVAGQRPNPRRGGPARRLSPDISPGIASRLTAAAEFSAKYSIYPPSISLQELTTAQALVLALFHSLLHKDRTVTMALIAAVDRVPQVWSSFIEVWLRDDYRFRRQDVAGMLSALSTLMLVDGVSLPVSIVAAMTGLEEKYQVQDFFKQSGDFTSQYLLVCLNHLVRRATGKSAELKKDSAVQVKAMTKLAWTQTTEQELKVVITTADSEKAKRSAEKPTKGKKKKIGSPPKKQRKIASKPAANEKANPVKNVAANLFKPILRPKHCIIIEKVKDYPPTIRIPETEPPASTSFLEPLSYTKKQAERGLLAAAVTGDPKVGEQALRAGAAPDCSDRWGRTPLHLAARHGHSRLVATLLAAGAAPDRRDGDGWTPLHRAAFHGSVACARLLLDRGADPRLQVNGTTPLGLAKWQGHNALIDLFRSKGRVYY